MPTRSKRSAAAHMSEKHMVAVSIFVGFVLIVTITLLSSRTGRDLTGDARYCDSVCMNVLADDQEQCRETCMASRAAGMLGALTMPPDCVSSSSSSAKIDSCYDEGDNSNPLDNKADQDDLNCAAMLERTPNTPNNRTGSCFDDDDNDYDGLYDEFDLDCQGRERDQM